MDFLLGSFRIILFRNFRLRPPTYEKVGHVSKRFSRKSKMQLQIQMENEKQQNPVE